jgi:hypothetical protein
MRYEAASSVGSMGISYPELDVSDEPGVATSSPDVQFDMGRLRVDLLGVGARFEGEAVGVPYTCEIDIIG